MLLEHEDSSITPLQHPTPNPKTVFLSASNTKISANFLCKNYHISRPGHDASAKNIQAKTQVGGRQ